MFDSDLSFKSLVDSDFSSVTGLDFDSEGRLVAYSQNDQVRVYDSSGQRVAGLGFIEAALGNGVDIKVGPNGNYFAGNPWLWEFSPTGSRLQTLYNDNIRGIVVLPSDVMWIGTGGNDTSPGKILRLNLSAGNWDMLPLTGGQKSISSMTYSISTNTVLVVDEHTHKIYERALDGSLVQTFFAEGFGHSSGATRGPNGDIFATDYFSTSIFRWKSNGVFVGQTSININLLGPSNILWAGALLVPESSSMTMLILGISVMAAFKRQLVPRHQS